MSFRKDPKSNHFSKSLIEKLNTQDPSQFTDNNLRELFKKIPEKHQKMLKKDRKKLEKTKELEERFGIDQNDPTFALLRGLTKALETNDAEKIKSFFSSDKKLKRYFEGKPTKAMVNGKKICCQLDDKNAENLFYLALKRPKKRDKTKERSIGNSLCAHPGIIKLYEEISGAKAEEFIEKILRSQFQVCVRKLIERDTNHIQNALIQNNFETMPKIKFLLLSRSNKKLLQGVKTDSVCLKKWYEKNDEYMLDSSEQYEEFKKDFQAFITSAHLNEKIVKNNSHLYKLYGKYSWAQSYLRGNPIKDSRDNDIAYTLLDKEALEIFETIIKNIRLFPAKLLEDFFQHPVIKTLMTDATGEKAFALFKTIFLSQLSTPSRTFLERNSFIKNIIEKNDTSAPFTQQVKEILFFPTNKKMMSSKTNQKALPWLTSFYTNNHPNENTPKKNKKRKRSETDSESEEKPPVKKTKKNIPSEKMENPKESESSENDFESDNELTIDFKDFKQTLRRTIRINYCEESNDDESVSSILTEEETASKSSENDTESDNELSVDFKKKQSNDDEESNGDLSVEDLIDPTLFDNESIDLDFNDDDCNNIDFSVNKTNPPSNTYSYPSTSDINNDIFPSFEHPFLLESTIKKEDPTILTFPGRMFYHPSNISQSNDKTHDNSNDKTPKKNP